jgi:hypothetical protein
VQKAQQKVQAGLNEFASGLRATVNVTNQLADAMERVARASRNVRQPGGAGQQGGPRQSGAAPSVGMALALPMRPMPSSSSMLALTFGNSLAANGNVPGGGIPLNWPGAQSPPNANPPGFNAGAAVGMMTRGLIAVQVVDMVVNGIGRLINSAKGLNDAVTILEQRGFSGDQVGELETQAYQIALATPGRNVAAILRDAGALRGVLGQQEGAQDPIGDVRATLPQVERTAAAISSIMPSASTDQAMHILMKAIELRGGLIDEKTHKIDPAKFSRELESIYKVIVAGGGMISPNDMLNVMQQAGPMARMMEADEFYKMMMAAIMDMKGNRAGTALSAAGRQMFGGVMSKKTAHEMEALGLLPPDSAVSEGMGVKLTPEARAMLDKEMSGGLLAFVSNYLRPALESHGYTTVAQQNAELYRVGSTETFRRLLALYLQNQDQVERDAHLLTQVPSVEKALQIARDKSIGFNMDAATTSISNFFQAIEKANAGKIIAVLHATQTLFNFLSQGAELEAKMGRDGKAAISGGTGFWNYNPLQRGFWLPPEPPANGNAAPQPVIIMNPNDLRRGYNNGLSDNFRGDPSGSPAFDYRTGHPGAAVP